MPIVLFLDYRWSADERSCNVVFFSARPHIYKDVAEDCSYKTFKRLVADGTMHSLPTLLPCKITHGF